MHRGPFMLHRRIAATNTRGKAFLAVNRTDHERRAYRYTPGTSRRRSTAVD